MPEALSACTDLEGLVSTTIRGLRDVLGYEHAVLMLTDETGARLLTRGDEVGTARALR
jgi:hypothetical protein